MEPKEIKINVPEGYEIDKENSTFECIKFKPIKTSKFSDYDGNFEMTGYYLSNTVEGISEVITDNFGNNRDVFKTEAQARSARAMAQISQIMANDERFGGPVTYEEWGNVDVRKFCIFRDENKLKNQIIHCTYHFLAFHMGWQRDLFLKENEQLVKDYLMID